MIESPNPHGLPADHAERMARARLSLEGLSVGDALGQRYFWRPDLESLIANRALPRRPWRYTDDTAMALSTFEILNEFGGIETDSLARLFGKRYMADTGRGYGATAHDILEAIARGTDWQTASSAAFNGEGSMGNGGAMRAGPIGAYFAGDLAAVIEHARRSAIVTHAHPEGQAGAIAVAITAATAHTLRSGGKSADGLQLLEAAVEYTPRGSTHRGLAAALALPFEETVETAVGCLGNGSRIIAHDTVPFAIWCAARHINDFETAFWTTVSGVGDIDTNCAIVGSIVAMAVGLEGIPGDWIESREPLELSY